MSDAVVEQEKPREEEEETTATDILAGAFKPVLDILDDIGGTVTLGAQTFAWLIRPPFRFAQVLGALDFIGAGSTSFEEAMRATADAEGAS